MKTINNNNKINNKKNKNQLSPTASPKVSPHKHNQPIPIFEDKKNIVIDCGSYQSKAGFAGEDKPISIIPTILGKTKGEEKDTYIGNNHDTLTTHYDNGSNNINNSNLSIKEPIERSVIQDWDAMEEMYRHIFYNQLKVIPEQHKVLLVEQVLNTKENREKLVELMFDKFNIHALYCATQAILTLYANGLTSGIVLESGHGVTSIVPVYEGYIISHAIYRLDLAGQDLNDYLKLLLEKSGYSFLNDGIKEMETINKIKETLCFVSLDYENDILNYNNRLKDDFIGTNKILKPPFFEMPPPSDSSYSLSIDEDILFKVPEILFKPIINLKISLEGGIHQLLFNSIMKCEEKIRPFLFSNIVLSGGTCCLKNFIERLKQELLILAPHGTQIKIIAPHLSEYCKHSAWIGGALLSETSIFQTKWFTKKDYQRNGASYIIK